MYVAHDESLLLQTGNNALVNPSFNLTEWWRIARGKKLSRPFNVGDELVAGVLRVLERISTCFFCFMHMPLVNQGCRGCPVPSFVPGQ